MNARIVITHHNSYVKILGGVIGVVSNDRWLLEVLINIILSSNGSLANTVYNIR